MQGADPKVVKALAAGNLEAAKLPERETALLRLIETLTRHAYKITDREMEELRALGWTDEQIFEAVFDGALFNFMVRMADAYGLPAPDFSALPEEVRRRL